MKIGLYDVDSKIPNLALMKLSTYHKQKLDIVKFWNAFEHFDKVYASKIFDFSDKGYIPKNAICGGSGFNYKSLPNEIEHCCPDYSLYGIDYAMGYLTRGCINQCSFCIVPKKEGKLRKHAELTEFWNNQSNLLLLDNALTDCDCAAKDLSQIRDLGIHLDLCQGFNVRTIKHNIASILADIKLWKNGQWKIAWDDIDDEDAIMKGIELLNSVGIKNYRLMCYVLVNFDSTLDNDLYRINKLQEMKIDPFVMIFNRYKLPKNSIYHKLGKWCNRPQLRTTCSFLVYSKKEIL